MDRTATATTAGPARQADDTALVGDLKDLAFRSGYLKGALERLRDEAELVATALRGARRDIERLQLQRAVALASRALALVERADA